MTFFRNSEARPARVYRKAPRRGLPCAGLEQRVLAGFFAGGLFSTMLFLALSEHPVEALAVLPFMAFFGIVAERRG